MKLAAYPGPFHTTAAGRVRIAAWVNCAGCGVLFVRATNDLRNKAKSSDGHHARIYCGTSCQKTTQPRKVLPMVPCAECGRDFQATQANKAHLRPGKHFCSVSCYRMWKGRHQSQVWSKAWDIYMAYHGIGKSQVKCEYCGGFGRLGISRKNQTQKDYRPGNLEAICNWCQGKRRAGKTIEKLPGDSRYVANLH